MNDPRINELRELLPRAMLADWVRLGVRLVRLLRDQHHPARHEEVLNRLLEQARASVALRESRLASRPEVHYPAHLPITARKDDVVAAIRAHQAVVLVGETGSGKTTQIPKMCLEAGLGVEAKIGCTQPRRVAALSISRRIAEELNVGWGCQVGCKIRFDDRSSPETFIKVMTDGILLAETQGDPLLSEYNALIIDEAHERSLNIDFLLGYLKGLLARRPELKLVITSATIQAEAFAAAFNAPVIEVSGRLFPVEVVYSPLDSASEESGDLTYIDAAARAAETILCEPGGGDVLIFMPGERDIRETSDLIRTRCGDAAEIIPLFGRLSSADQQRVFAPAPRRKVVVATNIAETSLTIPGIRYVIDSGLARISRYNPRTRIKRLPVEPISQSSANQRKGRSGRVQNGTCIRLYSEQDFLDRPPHTQPEIQRANLAEVILRMKAFRLGEIETFPFLDPPSPGAIQGGYALLQELGALDANRELTPLGHDLARLPIDPTLGRMLIQATREHATRELLIIAAGLSIQDPRERPLEQKDAANAAHKRFAHPVSDFLTLLNIWNAVHDQWEALRTQNQRRKFCKTHFLSYLRMREWQDLHAQLTDALEDLGTLHLNESNAAYEAIHRAILSGLLAHLARRTERNLYKGAGNRTLILFPGSALYERAEKPKKARGQSAAPAPPKVPSSQPDWIVAGEIVETSQLFARTVAGIEPEWILDLASHLCKATHQNPHWSPEAGRVLAEEIVTLYGLEVRRRKVAYGNIDAAEATRIFIRSALVEENLFPEPPRPREREHQHKPGTHELLASAEPRERKIPPAYKFLEHNRAIRQKIETWQTRVRRHDLHSVDDALAEFYGSHLENVSSVAELNRVLRGHTEPGFLCAKEEDLARGADLAYDPKAFPDAVSVGGQQVPLSYAYQPGEERDGVTVQLGFSLAEVVPAAALEWAVPGLREAQAAELLRALPKAIRRELMPLAEKVADIVEHFQPSGGSLQEDLGRFIHQRYGIEVPPSAWPSEALPPHLRPRIEIVAEASRKQVAAGRDLLALRRELRRQEQQQPTAPPAQASNDPAWARAAGKWERFGVRAWTFGDLPERVAIAAGAEGFPGLEFREGQVNVLLFRARLAASNASVAGVRRLVELALEKDLAWIEKDLRALAKFAPLLTGFCTPEELQQGAIENLRAYLFPAEPLPRLAEAEFRHAVERARNKLPRLAQEMIERVEPVLRLRAQVAGKYSPTAVPVPVQRPRTLNALKDLGATTSPAAPRPAFVQSLAADLQALLPRDFLKVVPFERLPHLPRYLKAMLLRGERAAMNPLKDQERARQLTPFVQALAQLHAKPPESNEARRLAGEFRWLVEEYKVSLFAQELGTSMPVSPKRLEAHLEKVRAS